MIASKTNPAATEFDTYTCLRCETTVAFGHGGGAFGNAPPGR